MTRNLGDRQEFRFACSVLRLHRHALKDRAGAAPMITTGSSIRSKTSPSSP
jgi:hypothetical protein